MAFFGVTLEKIESIRVHPDANRLDVAKAVGMNFQFVVPRNTYKVGDSILYFPIDSLLPNSLIKQLKMEGKFSGKEKNVVKTIFLRGQISQGYVVSPIGFLPEDYYNKTPQEITEYLKVIKYEVPAVETKGAILNGLPSGLSDYDIEGAERNQDVVNLLMNEKVVVFEKLEGENSSTFKNSDSEMFVNTRNRSVVEKEGFNNRYWNAARNSGILAAVKVDTTNDIGIYYELCGPGIHGNVYGLKQDRCFIFDIKVNGNWLDYTSFCQKVQSLNKEALVAPVIFQGKLSDFLAGQTVQQASHGPSQINPNTLREGIVIKPVVEKRHSKLGRLIIKQRCPIYLGKTGN